MQAGGQRFDPAWLHQLFVEKLDINASMVVYLCLAFKARLIFNKMEEVKEYRLCDDNLYSMGDIVF